MGSLRCSYSQPFDFLPGNCGIPPCFLLWQFTGRLQRQQGPLLFPDHFFRSALLHIKNNHSTLASVSVVCVVMPSQKGRKPQLRIRQENQTALEEHLRSRMKGVSLLSIRLRPTKQK